MRLELLHLFGALLGAFALQAQPNIDWQRNYGGSSPDRCSSIALTDDGGYAVLAYTASNDGDVLGFHGLSDILVLKLDATGELQWQLCLGGSNAETAGQIVQTSDGGYLLVGSSASTDGDVGSNLGGADIWLVRLSSEGDLLWEQNYGGGEDDVGVQVVIRPDGSFFVAGWSFSQDGDASDNHGASDLWLGHVDESGLLLQSRCYGGSRFDQVRVMHQLDDGGLVFGGVSSSNDGDVSGNPEEENQAWVAYLENGWDISWQRALGGSGDDQAYGLFHLEGDTILAAILSDSQDGDIAEPFGENDIWVVKLSSGGAIQGQRSFGGSGVDNPRSLISSNDGQSFFIAGSTSSSDGMIEGQHGGPSDLWVVHFDSNLDLLWQRTIGGTGADGANDLCLASDGGLVIGGLSSSSDGDATGTNGSTDVWVVKLDPQDVGLGETEQHTGLRLFPNPVADVLSIAWDVGAGWLSVYDTQGKLVVSLDRMPEGQLQHQLSVEGWADGLYAVQLNGTKARQVQRFAKQ